MSHFFFFLFLDHFALAFLFFFFFFFNIFQYTFFERRIKSFFFFFFCCLFIAEGTAYRLDDLTSSECSLRHPRSTTGSKGPHVNGNERSFSDAREQLRN